MEDIQFRSTLELWDESDTTTTQVCTTSARLHAQSIRITLGRCLSQYLTSFARSTRVRTILYCFEWYMRRLLSFCRFPSLLIGKELRSPGSDKYHSGPGYFTLQTRLSESYLIIIHDWRNRDVIFIMARYNTFEQGVTAV